MYSPPSTAKATNTNLPLEISLCAGSNPVLPSGASAINAMENAPYAIHTFVLQLSYESVKSAVLVTIRTNVLYVEEKVSQMHSIVLNVRD